jgi:hypothetical protein
MVWDSRDLDLSLASLSFMPILFSGLAIPVVWCERLD